MKRQFDAIVVGAGPAGSTTALLLARAGLKVALIERGAYPGAKNVSGAAFYGTRILDAILPRFWEEAPVQRYIVRRVIRFLSGDAAFSLDFQSERFGVPPYLGLILLRPQFDRWYAEKAREAGAVLLTSTVVDDLLWDSGRIVGVRCRREDGDLYAPVVVAADGVNAFLAKKAGLQREFDPADVSVGVKEVIALDPRAIEERFGVQGDEGVVHECLGAVTGTAYGGGFLYTNRDSLSVGVIVQIASLARERLRPYELLENFKAHPAVAPLVRGGITREYSAHMIPEGGYDRIPRLYGPGLLVTGDAAGLVLAAGLYLEGMNFAIASGEAAARAVQEAHRAGDFSAASLSRYQKMLEASFVLRDLKSYRHAGAFLNNPRVQNVYPQVLCEVVERVLTVDGRPRRKALALAREAIRARGLTVGTVLRDLWSGGRALAW